MMTFDERQNALIQEFSCLEDAFDRYDLLIHYALNSTVDKNGALRCEKNRIKECQSGLWTEIYVEHDTINISCDSDSLLVKGIATLVAKVLNGLNISEVREKKLEFLDKIDFGVDSTIKAQVGLEKMIIMIEALCAG